MSVFRTIFVVSTIFCSVLSTQKLTTWHKSSPTGFSFSLSVEKSQNSVKYGIIRGGRLDQEVILDENFDLNSEIVENGNEVMIKGKGGQTINMTLITSTDKFVIFQVFRRLRTHEASQDCFDLNTGHVNWYGGPQNRYQYWPIEKTTFQDYSYLTKEADNCGIAERYWLNSRGVFLFVDIKTPLFVDQNSNGHGNQLCLSAQQKLPYDTRADSFSFSYYVGVAVDSRTAHMAAVERFLNKPTNYPDERMVRHPIWSTWAFYKRDVNDSAVREFADNILEHKFNHSQLEIDDDWEDCYGALTFNKTKFPAIRNLTDSLKSRGFRVTLWIHPFINKNCEPWYDLAKEKGYLVADHKGNYDTSWWNSGKGEAAYIDFTNPEAVEWFSSRLKQLEAEAGIDSFKFDAGESSWVPLDPKLNGPPDMHPSLITTAYVREMAKFGSMIEVRSGQNTQDLPVFVRMIDKESEWSWDDGLPTLVTTLLQLNLAGYPFVLPDMIGGNGYNDRPPGKEMFIRWLQATVFMPSLQFSYVPWQYDEETIEISRKFTKLHEDWADYIIERFQLATKTGEPVNAPLWWIDAEDVVARQIYDQFLLGDKVIVAPVLTCAQTERDIYLPKGQWKDGNTMEIHSGPKWLVTYKAPLSVLPYFYRV